MRRQITERPPRPLVPGAKLQHRLCYDTFHDWGRQSAVGGKHGIARSLRAAETPSTSRTPRQAVQLVCVSPSCDHGMRSSGEASNRRMGTRPETWR